MKKVAIIGASGYSGIELTKLIKKHPYLEISGLFVSENSTDKYKNINELYPEVIGTIDYILKPLIAHEFDFINDNCDYVCLCTDHFVSLNIAKKFLSMNKVVVDLSGAFRLENKEYYEKYYGFLHNHSDLLDFADYGLAEWNKNSISSSKLIAVPGCYPTAALMALKPLKKCGLIEENNKIIVNAVSGISGAGRKATLNNSFCEVSLKPYGLFTHRHTPEINQYLGIDVLFTPHVGNFKRGILETIYVQLNEWVTTEQIEDSFKYYQNMHLVRVLNKRLPTIDGVVGTPFVDIGWESQGNQLIIVVAIDNLLKGAASQAVQCMNLNCGLPSEHGLL